MVPLTRVSSAMHNNFWLNMDVDKQSYKEHMSSCGDDWDCEVWM